MPFHVDSEVGLLKQAIVHRPGLELSRLTPANVDELLFDRVVWADRAREEHDAFIRQLEAGGVLVHEFQALLTESLDQPGARPFLQECLTTGMRFGPAVDALLDELIGSTPAPVLASFLIGGVLKRDVAPLLHAPSLLMDHLGPDDFLLSPLPNHLFQRDSSAWIYDGVSVNPMAERARRRETVNSRVVYDFHPMFAATPMNHLSGNDPLARGSGTVEGGDVTVIGNRAVMIGMGERSTPQGVEILSRRLLRSGNVDTVVVVELPKLRAFRHLDTVMTMVDRDAFCVHPFLPSDLRSFTLKAVGDGGDLKIEENLELFPVVADILGVEDLRILRTPVDTTGAERGQWDEGNNFLAVAPGVVLGHERNIATNTYLTHEGVRVVPVVGEELAGSRGGPRRMTCPIEREAVMA